MTHIGGDAGKETDLAARVSSGNHIDPSLAALRLMQVGKLHQALTFAELAVVGKSVCSEAHALLARILCGLGRREQAEATVLMALQLGPGTADAFGGLAHVSATLGRHDRASHLYRRAVQADRANPRFRYNLASAERKLGRLAEAESACNESIALDPTQYPSYLLRADLFVQTPHRNHVRELEALLAKSDVSDRGRMFLGYALVKELYDDSFGRLFEASRIRRLHLAYDVAVDERKLRARRRSVSPRKLQGCGPGGAFGRSC